jgi:2-hydroxy-3-keto-5-methylthiopentenyl-1-phosphate phosphatase
VITKILIQCDFDDTVTYKDISFFLLDAFAGAEWREHLEKYQDGKMSVGEFNRLSFSMVKAGRREMLDYIRDKFRLRPGLERFAQFCREKGFRLVIVSNGLDFYIEQILKDMGLSHIESHTARTIFKPTGLDVAYIGPAGNVLTDGFKEAYTRFFLEQGYRVIYAGDGFSDAGAARLAHKVFAIEGLLSYCRQVNLPCSTFCKLLDIAREIEGL